MIKIIHISFAKTNFCCPFCKSNYNDSSDKFLERLNSKLGFAKTICKDSCGRTFGVAVDITGQYIGFDLKNKS